MKIGGNYNWRGQPERLVYLGKNFSGNGYWHQFAKLDQPEKVWCELLDSDLSGIEETPVMKATPEMIAAGAAAARAYMEEHGGNSLSVIWEAMFAAQPAPPPAVESVLPSGSVARSDQERDYLSTVSELQALAKNCPHVTQDWVLEVASMDPADMRRRLIRSRDWTGHFMHSLDGIREIHALPGSGIDGCRTHKEIRAVVMGLLKRIEQLSASQDASPTQLKPLDGITPPAQPSHDWKRLYEQCKAEKQAADAEWAAGKAHPGYVAPSARPELDQTAMAFEAWWKSDGQFCRAGGGDYEMTFALRAWEASLAIPHVAQEKKAAQPAAQATNQG